jgi:deoxynucleotide monophosphate kinase-like protein
MLIAFSGLKGSGKDTAAKVLIDEYGFTKIAFADILREALLILNPWIPDTPLYGSASLSELINDVGWDWAKNNVPEVRRLMQVFGTEVGRMLFGTNVWVDLLAAKFPDTGNDDTRYVITDCRFDNEVDFVRNNGGIVTWIERPGLASDGHASESISIRDLASVILHNDETIEELHEDIRLMMFMRGIDPIE